MEFFGAGDAILVGLGHECENKASVVARLKQLSPELGKAQYKLLNINMTGGGVQYVEYMLVGYGTKCALGQLSVAWLGPMNLSVDKEMRIRKCELGTSPNAIRERAESGEPMIMCEVCRAVHQRFITALPKSTKAAGANGVDDDLLGGATLPSDGCHDASSVSSGEEETEEQANAAPRKEKETVDAHASLQGPGKAAGLWEGGGVFANSGRPGRDCLLRRGLR